MDQHISIHRDSVFYCQVQFWLRSSQGEKDRFNTNKTRGETQTQSQGCQEKIFLFVPEIELEVRLPALSY